MKDIVRETLILTDTLILICVRLLTSDAADSGNVNGNVVLPLDHVPSFMEKKFILQTMPQKFE